MAAGATGTILEEKVLALNQANSTYVSASKHVKMHLAKPKAKADPKGAAKSGAKKGKKA